MLLRQMRYFVAVVDCGSFTEAAAQCYISQSAISQQVHALEKELGVELIHRENRRFTLTPAGEYFYAHSRAILEQVELADLRWTPCILISSREQQNAEQEYYQNTLGFGGSYLFADSLEEGRLLVISNRGFLPVESVGTLPPEGLSIRRLPIVQNGKQILRNYCVFWRKEQANRYMEEVAAILRKLIL